MSKKKNFKKWRLVKELRAPARKNFSRKHVIVYGYDDLWQADVVEMHDSTKDITTFLLLSYYTFLLYLTVMVCVK